MVRMGTIGGSHNQSTIMEARTLLARGAGAGRALQRLAQVSLVDLDSHRIFPVYTDYDGIPVPTFENDVFIE